MSEPRESWWVAIGWGALAAALVAACLVMLHAIGWLAGH